MVLSFIVIGLLLNSFVVAESVKKALLWGAYRPNLYFGIRPRTPTGPTLGLMWGSVNEGKLDARKFRHVCEQSDKLATYGWQTYDARTGGVEFISDPGNAVNLTLEFVKLPERSEDWSLRISGVPLGDAKNWNTTVIIYVGVEEEINANSSALRCSPSSDGSVRCQGDYYMALPPTVSQGTQSSTVVKNIEVTKDRLWEAESGYIIWLQTGSLLTIISISFEQQISS